MTVDLREELPEKCPDCGGYVDHWTEAITYESFRAGWECQHCDSSDEMIITDDNRSIDDNRDNPSPKSAEEIEALRDQIADALTSDNVESGSQEWQKLEAAEAALDWTLGELEGFPRIVDSIE